MKKFSLYNAFAVLVFSAVALIMLAIPITATLHIDSAMVAGFTAAVIAAWMAAGPIHVASVPQIPSDLPAPGRGMWRACRPASSSDLMNILVLTLLLGLMALPLAVNDQVRSCAGATGRAFWLWIPPASLLFGYALGRFVRLSTLPAPRLLAVLTIVILTIFAWLPLLFSPRLFFFHPVIGYWPGALYDEIAIFPEALPWHRAMTLAWAALFWGAGDLAKALPNRKVQHDPSSGSGLARSVCIVAVAILFLAGSYIYRAELGLHAGRAHLQQSLGGTYEAGPVTLYYSKEHFSQDEIRHIAALHLFHFEEITDTLQIDPAQMKTIESYLYGNEWQMQALTGAKNVSYVPVWQATPQLHMRRQAIDATLRHELVHVVAREFGNRVLRASWSIGLVEGLAVALAPAHAGLSVDQQVKANEAFYSALELRRLFSLTGFYRISARVAYPVSGSFVAVLLQEFPVSMFRQAYRTSSLQGAYGDKLHEAIRLWHEKVAQTPVTESQRQVARAAFATPGLFDKPCPRMLGAFEKERELFRGSLAHNDTVQALVHLNKALSLEPGWQIGWQQYIRLTLAREGVGGALTVQTRAADLPDAVILHIMQADARFMLEQQAAGSVSDGWVREALAPFNGLDDETVQRALLVRANARRWAGYLDVVHADATRFKRLAEKVYSRGDGILWQVYAAEYVRRRHTIGGVPVGVAPIHPKGPSLLWQRLAEVPLHPLFCELARPLVLQAAAHVPISDLEQWGRASLCREELPGDHGPFVSSRELGLMEAVRFAAYLQQSFE